MVVWLIKAGEPTPLDPGRPHTMRAGNLARTLAARGHTVVWWTAAFDHQRRRFRQLPSMAVDIAPRLSIRFLRSLGYEKSVSLRRWLDDLALATSFYRAIRRTRERPDVIVCSYPLIFTSLVAVGYARRNNVRLVVDVRDMWPDIFGMQNAGWRSHAYAAFGRAHRPFARRVLHGADVLTAVTEPFLTWGLKLAGRARAEHDAVFPLTSFLPDVTPTERARAVERLRELGISSGTRNFCFFGAFTTMFDMPTVVEAAAQLRARKDIRFVLCGQGDELERVRHLAAGLDTLMLPGFVDAATMSALAEMSVAGLAPYADRQDSRSLISNKLVEYFAHGLPVIIGLEGLMSGIIERHDCGMKYTNAAGLARAVTTLADDPALRAKFSRNAKAVYEERFSPEIVYERFAQHVEYAATA